MKNFKLFFKKIIFNPYEDKKIAHNYRLSEYFPKSITTNAKSYQGLSCLDLTDKQTDKQTNKQTDIENYNIDI